LFISKKLLRFKDVRHGFFNRLGGKSKGIYKSLNCGLGSNDKKKKKKKNLKNIKKKNSPWSKVKHKKKKPLGKKKKKKT